MWCFWRCIRRSWPKLRLGSEHHGPVTSPPLSVNLEFAMYRRSRWLARSAEPGHQQARFIAHRPPRQDQGPPLHRRPMQRPNRCLAVIAQQLHCLVEELALVFRAGIFITSPQLLQNLGPCRLTHTFIHSGHGNPTSGATYASAALSTPSRVTKTFGVIRTVHMHTFFVAPPEW